MNFVFEKTNRFLFYDTSECRNFVDCPDINSSGIRRFTPSPIITTLLRYKQVGKKFLNFDFSHINADRKSDKFSKYIIATGVTHSPNDWCGSHRKPIFEYLNKKYLKDAQQGKALILLDQSHEGYHEEWVYPLLHNQCKEYNINPKQIIYVTGNLEETNQYKVWVKNNNIVDQMCIVPYTHFECMIHETKENRVRIDRLPPLYTFTEHVKYKKENINLIKTYNCLQKRPRAHRAWMFKGLVENNLLDYGINSMNKFQQDDTYYLDKVMTEQEYNNLKKYIPMIPPTDNASEVELKYFSDASSGIYPALFNEQVLLDTWMSVVSEASFNENTCFISEKTFKPIAAYHPFIVLGNKFTLKNLKEMGYKTFHPFIDESYDELDTWERMDFILKEITRINSFTVEEKLQWYMNMEDILNHNVETLRKNSEDLVPPAFNIIDEYFRNYNVPSSN